jgi:hypothetical protein
VGSVLPTHVVSSGDGSRMSKSAAPFRPRGGAATRGVFRRSEDSILRSGRRTVVRFTAGFGRAAGTRDFGTRRQHEAISRQQRRRMLSTSETHAARRSPGARARVVQLRGGDRVRIACSNSSKHTKPQFRQDRVGGSQAFLRGHLPHARSERRGAGRREHGQLPSSVIHAQPGFWAARQAPYSCRSAWLGSTAAARNAGM